MSAEMASLTFRIRRFLYFDLSFRPVSSVILDKMKPSNTENTNPNLKIQKS